MQAEPSGIDWNGVDEFRYQDEPAAVAALLAAAPLTPAARAAIVDDAAALVRATRSASKRTSLAGAFLRRFPLTTREGMALMSLAEALPRTPDAATRSRLISEKIASANWTGHSGRSDNLLVNAATRGLLLVAKLDTGAERPGGFYNNVQAAVARILQPATRLSVAAAVQLVGKQFVFGETIDKAISRARRERILCSFDMLGEGARTEADAVRYEHLYADAIHAVGKASAQAGPTLGDGMSIKLSALCPRYEAVQENLVWAMLYPRLRRLALLAAGYGLNLTVDAEETHRLVLSLQLIEALANDPAFGSWQGLGVVVQAYQKRAARVIDLLATLARNSGRRIIVRLVKGAYWDSEIKQAQIAGRPDFPVYTTKAATDLSYLVCARTLIAAAPALFPQFATHNAHTLAAVRRMAADRKVAVEYQRLHGMGEDLYAAAAGQFGSFSLRVYAPVGTHEKLLPYLVRRLLENGANNSFVSALLDKRIPVEKIVQDPVSQVESRPDRHPAILRPDSLHEPSRATPLGRDYSMLADQQVIAAALRNIDAAQLVAGPVVGGRLSGRNRSEITSPAAKNRIVGYVMEATSADLDAAVQLARKVQPEWDAMGGTGRGPILRAMADALENQLDRLVALLAREAGKTLDDGVAEVREAIDFCRYYANLAATQFTTPATLEGPAGETNQITLCGRGVFACISPWNFPLSIFTGQIAAALAAGNAVIAKPAEQTPLIAAEAVRLFHAAGLDSRLLALLPGRGEDIGAAIVSHPGIDGVAFTGGSDTALAINRSLAARKGRIIPLIAETGGLNCMFVDTTALREQVVDDVITSAIRSAGQRCSALRILFVPEERADEMLDAITGALATLQIGDPADPATDVGPVIDEDARSVLEAHVARLQRDARIIARLAPSSSLDGHYFGPVMAEIPAPDYLEREVFGPILHVFRYREADLEEVAGRVAARGYGLTLGIHTRRQRFVDQVRSLVPAGNCYVNRAMTGAVVGVQPFGGEGLSGTGPKAGGPHSLIRYATERSISINIAAQGGDPALLNL